MNKQPIANKYYLHENIYQTKKELYLLTVFVKIKGFS